MSAENQGSLYERLGGVYAIATVVDDFIDRLMVDHRLNANPAVDEAHHPVRAGILWSKEWRASRVVAITRAVVTGRLPES